MQNKKGLLIALILLVFVVALATTAYNILKAGAGETSVSLGQSQTSAATSADATADSSTAVAGQNQEQESADAASSAEATKLPEFNVTDRDGNTVALSSMYGKPTLVGFWATWCPPCNAEAPEIQKLYDEYGDRVNFMMINATGDGRDTAETVEKWMESNGYTYPVYLDESNEASIATQVYYLPTMYVLDSEGNLLTAFSGTIGETSGKQLIEQLLAL